MSENAWPIDQEEVWKNTRQYWTLPEDVAFLNHGSFGLPHRDVIASFKQYIDRAAAQPMDFFVRELEPELFAARDRLADFVGAKHENLVFAENATYGMNVVANSIELKPGDEILLTDHEYGAVFRIWQRACEAAGATVTQAALPDRCESEDQIVQAVSAAITDRTRLLVFSHITSASAMKLPAEKLIEAAHARGVEVCVDGPHAPAILPLDLESLDCEYYTAVCHKWVSAAHGTGFLYVNPRVQESVRACLLSWGRLLPAVPEAWQDEFTWTGTRDMACYLSVSAALNFLDKFGLDVLRERTHYLAKYARAQIRDLTGEDALLPESQSWYGSMITMPIRNDGSEWVEHRDTLRSKYQVEAPVYDMGEHRVVRASCYLYNTKDDIDRLVAALREMLY